MRQSDKAVRERVEQFEALYNRVVLAHLDYLAMPDTEAIRKYRRAILYPPGTVQ